MKKTTTQKRGQPKKKEPPPKKKTNQKKGPTKRGGQGGMCIRHGLSNDFIGLRHFIYKYKTIIQIPDTFQSKVTDVLNEFKQKILETRKNHKIMLVVSNIWRIKSLSDILSVLDDSDSDSDYQSGSDSGSDSGSRSNSRDVTDYDVVLNAYNTVLRNHHTYLRSIDEIILESFVTKGMLERYASFAIQTVGDNISIQCFKCTKSAKDDELYLEEKQISDRFVPYITYEVNLFAASPHLYFAHIVSHMPGTANQMFQDPIDVFNMFPTLKYIEADSVNPITYHMTIKRGFVPECIFKLEDLGECDRTDIESKKMLSDIVNTYDKNIKNTNTKLNTEQKRIVDNLYKNIRDNKFDGVKLRLYRDDVKRGSGSRRKNV
jgi:hypothetical protein